MEVVSWARLTSELGVAYTPVVAWSDQPALAEAARNAVSEQAAQDADVSSDDEAEDNRAAARGTGRRRSPVLWRRHGVDVRAVLNVDDLSPLEDQVVAAAKSGFVAADLVVGNIKNPKHPVRAAAGPEGLACGLFLSPTAPVWRALPRVLGVYTGAVRSRVEFDDAIAADPYHPGAQSFSFDLDFASADCWPQHPSTLECDSVLVDARVQRNEMAFVNDARGCVSRVCPLAPGVCADMPPCDAERISVRFVDVAVGGLPYVVMFQVAHVAPGEELLCDYGATYWVNLRRAYFTRRAVQRLLSPAEEVPEFAAALPPESPTQAPVQHRPRTARGGSGAAALRAPNAGRAPKQRAGMSAAAQVSPALSAGGAKLDELRVSLLQLDGAMPPVPRALTLPFGTSFDSFFERHIRKWRWELLEASDGAQLIRLANKLAGWMSPTVLRAGWNAGLGQDASPEEVVAALQAGVIRDAVDALWAEAEKAAASSGQALYALDEDATWHEVLSTQVARTRTATAAARGLSLLQLRNGADWRDAVLGALNMTGAGAPPPRITRLLMRAIRRRGSGGGLLDLNNARESRDEVERILALPLAPGPAGGAVDAPLGESQELPTAAPATQPAGDAAGSEGAPPTLRKRKREQRRAAASDQADGDEVPQSCQPPPCSIAARPPSPPPPPSPHEDEAARVKVELPPQPPPQEQPPPAAEPEVIDLTMFDD